MSKTEPYIQATQTKQKRQVNYTLKLSQHEYSSGGWSKVSQNIKDAFKRIKTYYAAASVSIPGGGNTEAMVPIEFEYEIQAMFPSLASIAAIGDGGVVNVTANTLNIKSTFNFFFKRLQQTTPTNSKGV